MVTATHGATFPGSAPLFRFAAYGNRRTWPRFLPSTCRVEFAQKAAQNERATSRPRPSQQETQGSHELSFTPPSIFDCVRVLILQRRYDYHLSLKQLEAWAGWGTRCTLPTP